MVKLLIVYYSNEQILSMEIDHKSWISDVPDTILKLYVQKSDNIWSSIEGWNAYIVKEIDGICHVGEITNTELFSIHGKKIQVPLESVINSTPELKFGVAVSNEVWEQVKQMEFV